MRGSSDGTNQGLFRIITESAACEIGGAQPSRKWKVLVLEANEERTTPMLDLEAQVALRLSSAASMQGRRRDISLGGRTVRV